jgi:transcriptional regulator with XRE-family HTH domain
MKLESDAGRIDRHVGRRLAKARLAKGYVLHTLARELGMPVDQLAAIEAGEQPLSALLLYRVGKLLDEQIWWFFADAPDGTAGIAPSATVTAV